MAAALLATGEHAGRAARGRSRRRTGGSGAVRAPARCVQHCVATVNGYELFAARRPREANSS
jgi:hypothetical protein